MAILDSVNLGAARPSSTKVSRPTGIDKRPHPGAVSVRAPGPRKGGLGSGIVGDFIGSAKHHGGDLQAVYAYAREDLDEWEQRLNRPLSNGFFGENLTTRHLDVSGARLGEQWRIGANVLLQVTIPRIPCNTFRGWVGERGWLKMFTTLARPGAYLSVLSPGEIRAGDVIELVHRPAHDVTISLAYRALMTEPNLLPRLLEAGDDLVDELREAAAGK